MTGFFLDGIGEQSTIPATGTQVMEYEFTGLIPGKEYDIQVTAINSLGKSNISKVKATTKALAKPIIFIDNSFATEAITAATINIKGYSLFNVNYFVYYGTGDLIKDAKLLG